MANVRISAITAAASAAVTDQFVIENASNVSKKLTGQQIADMVKTAIGMTTGSVLFAGASGLTQDNANLFWDDSNNRLGLGTASPLTLLHLLSTLTGTTIGSNPIVRVQSSGVGKDCSIQLSDGTDAAYISMLNADLHFSPTSATSALVVKATSGNVGIANASPACKADVAGTLRTTSVGAPASGAGVEINYGGSGAAIGEMLCYDRTGAAWKELRIRGTPLRLQYASSSWITLNDDHVAMGVGLKLLSYTVATVPTAAIGAGALIYVSNESGGATPAFSDGTNWRRVSDRAIIS